MLHPNDTEPLPDAEAPTAHGLERDASIGHYAERALREAMEAGLTPRELDALLLGRSITGLVPPGRGEDLTAYADRATSELFILYLAEGVDALPGA